jgi:hypothetical protein
LLVEEYITTEDMEEGGRGDERDGGLIKIAIN